MRRTACLQIAVFWLLAGVAEAKFCGNDIGGRSVLCACGDVVVSDVVLDTDPVVHTVCPGDGLIVRAPEAAHGVTIDLHGGVLHGTGKGTGVWIINGGPGGARLVSRGHMARIDGFRDGIVARGTNSVALIDGIVAIHSARDGVRIQAPGYAIHAAETRDSGRDGFSLGGTGFQVTATRAVRSTRFGYFVMGANGVIGRPGAGNSALGSGHAAFSLTGVGHHLSDCHAADGTAAGVHLNGMHFVVSNCVAQHNGSDGIAGSGGDIRLSGNQASGNGHNGLSVHGVHMVDGGGNRGTGNGDRHQQRPPTQCEIGNAPCTR